MFKRAIIKRRSRRTRAGGFYFAHATILVSMEFEKNAPTTAQDEALADAPHVTLQPVHGEVKADFSNTPAITGDETKRTFDFETESTAAAAVSNGRSASHPHRLTAILLAIVIALLFAGGLYVLYSLR